MRGYSPFGTAFCFRNQLKSTFTDHRYIHINSNNGIKILWSVHFADL